MEVSGIAGLALGFAGAGAEPAGSNQADSVMLGLRLPPSSANAPPEIDELVRLSWSEFPQYTSIS